ncbi:MAG: FecR family protein [Gemmatimonadaceae bacterium]
MTRTRTSLLAFLAAGLLFAAQAFAAANIANMTGDVRVGYGAATPNMRVEAGQTLTTGPGAQVTLVFDDKQQVVLDENTSFKITDYRFKAEEPHNDRMVFDLLRGAMRFVTGIIGARNRDTVAVRTPQATIGIRGTDFSVALTNQTYFTVSHGAIGVSNGAGSGVFGEGSIGTAANANSLATAIPASSLPPAVSTAFSNLAAVALTPAVTAAGAEAATGAATGTVAGSVGTGVGAAIAVGVGAAIIGTSIDNGQAATSHH